MKATGWLAMWGGLSLALVAGVAPGARRDEVNQKPAAVQVAESASKGELSVGSNVTVQGRIVWLGEALHQRYGIEHDERDAKTAVAMETTDGRLVPLVKDSRGRGFWLDERLHGLDMELMVRQRPGLPWAQVIRVYTLHDGEKFELDYWCDICAIPMFELKPCECCQGETRLRQRAADGTER